MAWWEEEIGRVSLRLKWYSSRSILSQTKSGRKDTQGILLNFPCAWEGMYAPASMGDPSHEWAHAQSKNKQPTGKPLLQVLCCFGNPSQAIILLDFLLLSSFYGCALCYFNKHSLCLPNNAQIAGNEPFVNKAPVSMMNRGSIFFSELHSPARLAYAERRWLSGQSDKLGDRSRDTWSSLCHPIMWGEILVYQLYPVITYIP